MSRRAEPQPSDLIENLQRENARLRRELEREKAERARVERDRARLEHENTRLKDEFEAERRVEARQAAPFSKGVTKRRPCRPSRKAGRAYGRRGQRPVPPVVHERHDVSLPPTCPACSDRIRETHIAAQYQEDLPPGARWFGLTPRFYGSGRRVVSAR
jgi:predicted nuclease with TOPRIM domain